ncbi:MAG: right-handed parallel beta-helix repeat-containing protein [Chitinophagaceae bacterium]
MIKRIIGVTIVLFSSLTIFSQQLITKGLRITKSCLVKTQFYKIDATDNLTQPLLVIEGNNITIDFKNAVLKGSNKAKNPDEFVGVAIMIRNSKNVIIKNLKVRSYKVAILARNTEGLVLDNCDLSYNYRQHLNSTQEKEDISDWMSYHHNENDEWLRYGAAIYLRNCNKATIKNCKVTGGQNSLMMMECNDGMIYNNDFSFNSGIGIGFYKCSRNSVLYNRIIFNVRGYSDGVYNRGQDSAGILVYEQSNNNLFYKNNVTHSGDGFFLWAGQTTMDNGQGGCNDNIIANNDFSYAPTNGVEVTFSRNVITGNRIIECDNGIWGGYSFESRITNNKFRNNKRAIAIEHGQYDTIAFNIFYGDKTAINLWGREKQPEDWGYAKNRDTRSRAYILASNNFNSNETVYKLQRTDSLNVFNNIYSGYNELFNMDTSVTNLDTAAYDEIAVEISKDADLKMPPVEKPGNPFRDMSTLSGKKNIMIGEWGPYDFRSPVIWNTNPTDTSGVMRFEIAGPKGNWRLKSSKGLESLSASVGEFPASVVAKPLKADRTDILIELEYRGEAFTDPYGKSIAKGKPYTFSFRKFFQPVTWYVGWFALDTTVYNPIRTSHLFPNDAKTRPLKREETTKLDYTWWSGLKTEDSTYAQYITIAQGSADFQKGVYELSLTCDDAARIYLNDKLILDEWNPAIHLFDEAPNRRIRLPLNGKQNFRVEHLNLGGLGVLSLKIKPVE